MNKRQVTYGRLPGKPDGALRQINFPELARLDEGTNEGMIARILHSEGGEARNLPRTIYFQKTQTPGHFGSVAIGAIHEMSIDGESGVLSGRGWLADVPEARDAVPFILTQSLFHNSVDLAEVTVREEQTGDWFSPDFHIDLHFDKWKLAATTFVGKPAFANAHGVLADEIQAALEDDSPIEVAAMETKLRIVMAETDAEITAAMTSAPPWSYFHSPEPEQHHKIVVGEPDKNGWIPVCGHLGLWDSRHDGYDHEVVIPRPRDNYASFNKAGVLTDEGQIETGPIALKGGHFSLSKALDSVENAWADVRCVAGKHGPWLSGVVRPGTSDEDVYAARASRISGHWKGGRLKAIVSVNAEGFDVPGSGFSFMTNAKGEVAELVASYPGDTKPKQVDPALLSMTELTPAQVSSIISTYASGGSHTISATTASTSVPTIVRGPNIDWSSVTKPGLDINHWTTWLNEEFAKHGHVPPVVIEATVVEDDSRFAIDKERLRLALALDEEDVPA